MLSGWELHINADYTWVFMTIIARIYQNIEAHWNFYIINYYAKCIHTQNAEHTTIHIHFVYTIFHIGSQKIQFKSNIFGVSQ